MSDYSIRRAKLSDIEAVYAIECAVYNAPWSLDSFEFEIITNPVAHYFVVEYEDKIIAYAGIHVILEEAYITNIAVLSAYRQKGIGTMLLSHVIKHASKLGATYITLEVRTSNAAAISLYKRFGFHTVNIRKNYYQDTGEDAFLMLCDELTPMDIGFAE